MTKKIVLKNSLFFLSLLLVARCEGRDFSNLYQQSLRSSLTKNRDRKRLEDYVLSDHERVTYLGEVKIATRIADDTLPLRMYYQGDIVPCVHGSFKFPGSKKITTLHILVAHIKPPRKNTIDHLEVPKGTSYKLFTLSKEPVFGAPEKAKWKIEEEEKSDGLVIPENCLIVLLDPQHIDSLETAKWARGSKFVPLPSIVLKKDNNLQEALDRSMLAALDSDVFHERWEKKIKTDHKNSIVSREK